MKHLKTFERFVAEDLVKGNVEGADGDDKKEETPVETPKDDTKKEEPKEAPKDDIPTDGSNADAPNDNDDKKEEPADDDKKDDDKKDDDEESTDDDIDKLLGDK